MIYKEDKINEINSELEKLKNKNVVIWGAGEHTENLLKYTIASKLKILAIVDKYKPNEYFYGFESKNPQNIDWKKVDGIIISAFGHEFEIIKELEYLKYNNEIIRLYNSNNKSAFYKLQSKKSENIIEGFYNTWTEAKAKARGYEDENILKNSIENLKQKNNRKYEHIISVVQQVALNNKNQSIKIVDFGGALGNIYFDNKFFLDEVDGLRWYVIEQGQYAKYGKSLENGVIKFFDDINKVSEADVVILVGSIQYIENYEDILKKVIKLEPKYIIVDRTPVSLDEKICVQKVKRNNNNNISYAMRIFKEDNLIDIFSSKYKVISKFNSLVDGTIYFNELVMKMKCYILKMRM